ncbi:MAG: enoyl-CoA hydratase-related protein [Solirubrobacteraceae bacterium]
MNFENIILEINNFIAKITINRPNALNALNAATLNELSNALDLLKDDKKVKVVVVTGSGEKAFVAGADIKELANLNGEQGKQVAKNAHEKVFNKIENLNKPVIAAINGFALGGGLELALACHIRIASTNAKMGLPEVTLGLIPGYGGTQRLAQVIGKGIAMQAIFTAQFFDSAYAEKIGLVNEVVVLADLQTRAEEIASQIIKNSSTAISKAIECINLYNQPTIGFEKEINSFGELIGTNDYLEGTKAFIEKRKPNFE